MSLRKLKGLGLPMEASVDGEKRLKKLAEEISDGCLELDVLGTQARDVHARVLNRVRLQGDALIEVKKLVGHRHFLPWLAKNVNRIKRRTAQNWMKAARWAEANTQAFAHLESVAQLYVLAGILPAPEQPELSTEPVFSLAIAMRWLRPVARIDVQQALALPPEERCVLLTALEPANATYEALKGSVAIDVATHTNSLPPPP